MDKVSPEKPQCVDIEFQNSDGFDAEVSSTDNIIFMRF